MPLATLKSNFMKRKDEKEIRSFIAIDITNDVRKVLKEFLDELKQVSEDVRWVRVEGIHLTLKFLGNVKPALITHILKAVEKSVAGIGYLRMEIKGTGAFPNLKKPRVFWVGVNEESGKLNQLASALDKQLSHLGFKEEDRLFKPHLTLGRVQRGRVSRVCDIIRKEGDKNFGEFEAREIILFRSELKPTGAEYTRLGVVPLK